MIPIELKWQKLLIVDDDPTTRLIVRKIAENLSMEVLPDATDGSEAIERVLTDPPQFVLCDIMMEPMDGLSFLKAVRLGSEGLKRDLKVLIFSSMTANPYYGTALALDADAFLAKPLDPKEFRQKLLRCYEEPTPIREIEAYEIIQIPGSDSSPGNTASITSDKTIDAENQIGIKKTIQELKEGDVLARDLCLSDGSLLLAAEMKISKSLISKLCDLADLGKISTAFVDQ